MEAVLEESRASRAALLAEATQQAHQAAAPTQSACNDNGACDAEATVAPPAMPAARQTVVLGASCSSDDAGAVPTGEQEQGQGASVHAAGPAASAVQLEEASVAQQLMEGCEASGSECSVPSRASSDDEPDSLEELD